MVKHLFMLVIFLTSLVSSALPALAAQVSTSGNMRVMTPRPNDVIASPLIIEGEARVFENQFNWRLKDGNGVVITEGTGTANAPDVGFFGSFSARQAFTPAGTATGTVEVFDFSARDGSIIDLVRIPVRFATATETNAFTVLFRLYQPRNGDHFYTTRATERAFAISNLSYIAEDNAGSTFLTSAEDRFPLYRLYNPRTGDHFYTRSNEERTRAVSMIGYRFEGTEGFMTLSPTTESPNPLYRLYNPRIQKHFYTTSAFERERAAEILGYLNEGVVGYVR